VSVFGPAALTGAGMGRLLHPGYRVGAFYSPLTGGAPATANNASADLVYLFPLPVVAAGRFSGAALRVGTAVASALGKLAVFDNAGGIEGVKNKIADCVGELDMNATAGNTVSLNFASSIALAPGFYWVASLFSLACQPYTVGQTQTYAGGLAPFLGSTSMTGATGGTVDCAIRVTGGAATYAAGFPAQITSTSFASSSPGSPISGLIAA